MVKIKVYSSRLCPWCTVAKNFFKEKGIKFEEVNVEEDEAAADEMVKKSGQRGVPVIEIGDKILVGFNQKAIEEALLTK